MNRYFSTMLLCALSATVQASSVAYFAGGCFWCMQAPFEKVKGVTKTVVGYMGGHRPNPTYQMVSAGGSGYYEMIAVYYDEKQVSYDDLLKVFWHNIDPTDATGQFCDRGDSYRTAIFYDTAQQKQLALASKKALIHSGKIDHVVTPVISATHFYPAENYHQKYYQKNPVRYKFYRYRCGRDAVLKKLWG